MKCPHSFKVWRAGFGVLLLCLRVHAQGTFVNLGFEQAVILPAPGDPFNRVQFAPAFPGWTGYVGTNSQSAAYFNGYTAGSASLDIVGPGWSQPVLEGSYTAILQAGIDLALYPIFTHVRASISQSGVIPAGTRSFQMKVVPFSGGSATQFTVEFDGQLISLVPLSTTANYTVYGADVTSFAGLTKELRISAIPTATYPFSSIMLDGILFSDQPIVPEPGTGTIFLLGIVALAFSKSRRTK